jgi:lysophospholipase L1-like esterase
MYCIGHWELVVRSSRKFAVGLPVLVPRLVRTVLGAAVLAAAGLSAAAVATAAPARAATAVSYVALGDSYAAGVGAGSTSGSCSQSPNAYPRLWAAAHSVSSFTFAACSDATTADVISSQLSALSPATTLVSVTAGGNDVGFVSIMETCILESTSSCESAVAKAEQYAATTLPGNLDTMLADIRAKAPGARIVVTGYPVFYDTSKLICIGLSSADHQALDAGINDLDGVIATAAAKYGDPFADVRAQFSGHEICDGSAWLNSVTLPISSSYHPTATGQKSGYLPVFTAAATPPTQ